jgi:hypothetical protein
MTRYVIRRIELRSAFQFGFVAGFVTLLLPGLLAGLLAWWLVARLQSPICSSLALFYVLVRTN